MISGVVNGAMAGGCKSMFGSGVIAFEPTALQWVAPDGHEEILNNVAYRANGAEVIVLTKDPGAVPALIFGFPDHDRAVVAFFNCTMDRVGAKPRAAAAPARASAAVAAAVPATVAAPSGPANAVLDMQVGIGAPGHLSPLPGLQFWVTPQNPAEALAAAGIMPASSRSVGEFLNADCRNQANCIRDWNTMTGRALGSVRTDAAGHARTPPIQAGRYYIVGFAPDKTRGLFWSLPVDARPGSNAVTLNQTNGAALHQ
jgi:hypothetical protein